MITVKISADTLFYLLNKDFSMEACEAICDFWENWGGDWIPSLDDIFNNFCEIPTDEVEENEPIVKNLSNGYTLINK